MSLARLGRAVALLLLAWQAVVVQAHAHVRVAGPVTASPAISAPATQRSNEPLDCPVCRIVAQAGQYVSPGTILFQPPAATAIWRSPLPLASRSHASHSHAWRSRAPPLPLSA